MSNENPAPGAFEVVTGADHQAQLPASTDEQKAQSVETLSLRAFQIEHNLSLAQVRHMMHTHREREVARSKAAAERGQVRNIGLLTMESEWTADLFAELLDASNEARV